MATHSSVLAWRIPGMGEPGGLPSRGLHRVGHYWSDLAVDLAYIYMYVRSINNLIITYIYLYQLLNHLSSFSFNMIGMEILCFP